MIQASSTQIVGQVVALKSQSSCNAGTQPVVILNQNCPQKEGQVCNTDSAYHH